MSGARKVQRAGCAVKFASPEDVIIHKMFAGRPVDFEDAKNTLLKRKNKIHLRYLKKWLSEFESLSGKKLANDFNRLNRASCL